MKNNRIDDGTFTPLPYRYVRNHTECIDHSGILEAVEVFRSMHADSKKAQHRLDEDIKDLSGKVMNIQGRLQAFSYIFGTLLTLLCSISVYSFLELSEFKNDHYITMSAYNAEIQKSIAVIEQKLISLDKKVDYLTN